MQNHIGKTIASKPERYVHEIRVWKNKLIPIINNISSKYTELTREMLSNEEFRNFQNCAYGNVIKKVMGSLEKDLSSIENGLLLEMVKDKMEER